MGLNNCLLKCCCTWSQLFPKMIVRLRLFQVLIVAVGVISSLALQNCKSADPVPSKTDLLTAHPWFLVGFTETPSVGGTVDRFPAMPNCLKDNTLSFRANQFFTYSPGNISCNGEGSRDIAWSFATNETRLLLAELPEVTHGHIEVEIVMLTTDVLQLRYAGCCVYTYSDKGNFTPPSADQQVVFRHLTAHKWRMSSYWMYGNTSGSGNNWVWTDLYAPLPNCRRDDFLQFNPNHTVVNDEGTSRCASTDPQTNATTWGLSELGGIFILRQDVLRVYIPGLSPGGIQVSDSTLKLRSSYTNQGNGSSTTVVYKPF